MAEIAVVNGNTVAPSEQIGRDVIFIGIEAANAVLNDALPDVDGVTPSLTNLDLVRKIVDQAASITMIGETNSDTDVAFMVEGAGFAGPTLGPAYQLQINEIRDQVEAANGAALGTTVCTISHLEGVTLVVDFTDA